MRMRSGAYGDSPRNLSLALQTALTACSTFAVLSTIAIASILPAFASSIWSTTQHFDRNSESVIGRGDMKKPSWSRTVSLDRKKESRSLVVCGSLSRLSAGQTWLEETKSYILTSKTTQLPAAKAAARGETIEKSLECVPGRIKTMPIGTLAATLSLLLLMLYSCSKAASKSSWS